MKTENIKRQKGLTMIEVMAVLFVLGLVSIQGMQLLFDRMARKTVDEGARRSLVVANAAKRFHLETGDWPTSPADLNSDDYLVSSQLETLFGGSYTFTEVASNLEISQSTPDGATARRMAGLLPDSSTSGSTVSFLAPVHSAEAVSSFVPLNGDVVASHGSFAPSSLPASVDSDASDATSVMFSLTCDIDSDDTSVSVYGSSGGSGPSAHALSGHKLGDDGHSYMQSGVSVIENADENSQYRFWYSGGRCDGDDGLTIRALGYYE